MVVRRWGWLVVLSVAMAATACARLGDAGVHLFSSSSMAVAVVGQQLVQGELQVFSDDSGFISLVSDPQQSPVLRCAGRMPYGGHFEREIDLRCSNGLSAQLRLSLRTGLRGFGYGGEGRDSVSLVFGLSPQETASLLRLPTGWSLQHSEGRYWLQAPGVDAPPPPASTKGASAASDSNASRI